jgi:hypothetical protein
MTQLDLSATPMRNCFLTEPDLAPYASVPNRIPLNTLNKHWPGCTARPFTGPKNPWN